MSVQKIPKRHLERIFDQSPWTNPRSYEPERQEPGISFGGLCVILAVSVFLGFALAVQL